MMKQLFPMYFGGKVATLAQVACCLLVLLLRAPVSAQEFTLSVPNKPTLGETTVSSAASGLREAGQALEKKQETPTTAVLNITVNDATDASGKRVVTVKGGSRLKPMKTLFATLTLEGSFVQNGSLYFGSKPRAANSLESKRSADALVVRVPAQEGNLSFGGKLVTSLTGFMRLGKIYDTSRGGEQFFALLVDFAGRETRLVTLVLNRAPQKNENIEIEGKQYPVIALNYSCNADWLKEAQQKGTIYVARSGRILRCDSPLFGFPIRNARAREDVVALDQEGDLLVKDVPRESGHEIQLVNKKGARLFYVLTDKNYKPTYTETWWRSRKFTAVIDGSRIEYKLYPSRDMPIKLPEGVSVDDVWFFPHLLVPSLWEPSLSRSSQADAPPKQSLGYVPLSIGEEGCAAFVLDRLSDVPLNKFSATRKDQEEGAKQKTAAVRHYRMTPKTRLGLLGFRERAVYDLYTAEDGLVCLIGSDSIRIIRNGWEAFASQRPMPAVIAPSNKQDSAAGGAP